MNKKYELIYEGKAKKVFSHDDSDKVIIEFKDDATAFNALKKARFEGKGKLNCLISAKIFEKMSRVSRERAIHKALGSSIMQDIHALSIKFQ